MSVSKTATLTFRINPNLKEALRTAAAAEHRSIANMIEFLIRGYCVKQGIEILLSTSVEDDPEEPLRPKR